MLQVNQNKNKNTKPRTAKPIKAKATAKTEPGEQKRKLAAIKKRLSELNAKHGHLTAEMVLNDARDPRSPLHDRFEWDDSTAAEAYRIIQARVLIKTIRYECRVVKAPAMRVPEYVRDPKQAGRCQGYIAVPRTDKDAAQDFLLDELDRALGLLRRAQAYASDTNQKAVAKALGAAVDLLEPFVANRKEEAA